MTAALGWIALLAAALNLWIFSQRRADRGHLWLAVASLGIALYALPTALLYASRSSGRAIVLHRAQLGALAVLGIGFVRFSEELLRTRLRWVERIAIATIAGATLVSFAPGLVFTGRACVRPLLGLRYVDAEATGLGALVIGVFLGLSGRLFVAHLRPDGDGDAPLRHAPGATLLWFACSLGDLASGLRWVELPSLLPLGYLGFVIAFTAARLRRFVTAMTAAEARAALLERLAAQRAQMLRAKQLQLAHGERLAAAGTLAAGLAHEINNPVAFVLANLNHLQALRKEEDSADEIEEVLLETQEGVARLRGIVDELMRLARTGERGNEPADLARVVESVLPMVRHEAGGRVRIETALAATPPVLGDPRLLGQVVLNLLQNAIHALAAADQEGTVRVALAPVAAGVELSIRDDGPGIPADVLPRIFEPFFTTKTAGQGTGLGLAVTREIVSRHGGSIDVETGSAGTRFRVTLPAAPS